MTTRLIAVIVLVMAFISFPMNKTVDVEIIISKHEEKVVHTHATMKQKRANKKLALKYAKIGYGWVDSQQACVVKLFTAESRFDHLAKNPKSTAFGIAQVLTEKSKDPSVQILRAYKYIIHRYGSPCNAWAFHSRNYYY